MQDVSPALYQKLQIAHMGKTVITIQLDNEVLDWFRNRGTKVTDVSLGVGRVELDA